MEKMTWGTLPTMDLIINGFLIVVALVALVVGVVLIRSIQRWAKEEQEMQRYLKRVLERRPEPASGEGNVAMCPECGSVLWEKSHCGVCGYELESESEH